jgi:hypothetical protein
VVISIAMTFMMMTRMTGFRKVVVPQLTAIEETDPTSGLRLVDLLSAAGAVVEIRDESYLLLMPCSWHSLCPEKSDSPRYAVIKSLVPTQPQRRFDCRVVPPGFAFS